MIPTTDGQFFSRVKMQDGSSRLVWLLTFLPGVTLAQAKPHSSELLGSLGALLAEIDTALLDFSHPATTRDLKWDVSRSLWARDYLPMSTIPSVALSPDNFLLSSKPKRSRVSRIFAAAYDGDATDHNALVSSPWPLPRRVLSVIDFGDMHVGFTVAEPAVAAAYAILGHEHPLPAASALLSAYHKIFPLREEEIAAFFPMLCARLAVSVINSAHRQSLVPDDPTLPLAKPQPGTPLRRLAKFIPASLTTPSVPLAVFRPSLTRKKFVTGSPRISPLQ